MLLTNREIQTAQKRYLIDLDKATDKHKLKLEKLKTERASDIASVIACSLTHPKPSQEIVAWEDENTGPRRRTRTENIRIRRPSSGNIREQPPAADDQSTPQRTNSGQTSSEQK